MTRVYAYGGAYYRDGLHWYYSHNNEEVPGSHLGVLEMNAPELLVHQMMNLEDVAKSLGITPASVSRMLLRNEVPEPQYRVGKKCPLWARPIIEHWIDTRPGRGVNLRKENRQ